MDKRQPDGPRNDLFKYMQDASVDLQQEYARIRVRSTEDPGTAGDNGEQNWAELLRKWVPPAYRVVTKGRIMGTKGECSPQVDVLILSPAYPTGLLNRKEYLEGGVVAAFECKLTLRPGDIDKAVATAAAIRRLSRAPCIGNPARELRQHVHYGLLAHSQAVSSEAAVDRITARLVRADERHATAPWEMIDWICVSDLATWSQHVAIITVAMLTGFPQRYPPGERLQELISAGGAVEAGFLAGAAASQPDAGLRSDFTPLGALMASLLTRMAWNDPALRSVAEYFVLSGISGFSGGRMRIWPLTVLSRELVEKIRGGQALAGGDRSGTWRWNDWSCMLS